MAPAPNTLTDRSPEGNSGKLSYFFAFGAAIFVISGNHYVAAFFGLMAAAAIFVTIKNLPPGGRRTEAEPPPSPQDPTGSASAGIDA